MWKFVIPVIAGYILYRFFLSDKKKHSEEKAAEEKKRVEAGELVKDPICGTYVDKEHAISVRSGKDVLYFCSYECRQKYLDELKGK